MKCEKQFNRNILKAFLEKQIFRCANNEYYVFGILVSNTDKIKLVKLLIEDILKNNYYKDVQSIKFNQCENRIIFTNGSKIDIIVAMESYRGKRYNGLVIDSNIENELKYCIGYAKVLDYPPRFLTSKDDTDYKEDYKALTNKTDIIEINIG